MRTKSFEKIFEDIKTSKMKYPEKHYLIQGQRGMGKTTLLLRLKYEVENSEELNKWLLPVFFSEESYDLTSLSGLWEKLLKFLDEEFSTGGSYYEHTEDFIDLDDYEKRCFDYLIQILNSKQKKIILFFDNFGQLFLDNLKEKEKRRFREILLQCSNIRIIGASAIVLQDLHDYSQPFYEFFQIVHLEGLSKEETYQLIERLQEGCEHKIDLKKNKGKIDTLAILTGGVIRTLMMVYEVLLDDQDGSALSDLEVILDQVTPLYKHRIEDLPIQQRRIVDVIAKRWDAISAKEIAADIREDGKKVQTKLISAQLAQLEKNNVIEKKQTNTKNHLYQLKERFFNIWYLMRNGDRRDRRKVKWLTKFLEMWYDDEESIESFLERHILRLKSGDYNAKSALLLAEALADINKVNPIVLDHLMEATSSILNEDQRSQLNMEQLKFALAVRSYNEGDIKKGIDILERTNGRATPHEILLSFFYFKDEQIENAKLELLNISEIELADLELLRNICILLKDPNLFLKILNSSPKVSKAILEFEMGGIHYAIGEYALAEKYYWEAFNSGISKSLAPLAHIYVIKGDLLKAEELFLAGYKEGDIDSKEILDFYYFDYEAADVTVKTKAILASISVSDNYYNFYHGIDLLKSRVETDESYFEIKKFFEKAINDFDKAGIRDLNYQQAVGHALILNLGPEPNKGVIKDLLPRLDELKNLKIPIKIYQAFTLAWFGEYTKAVKILNSKDVLEEVLKKGFLVEDFNDAILMFLSKGQLHVVLDMFTKFKDLKEALKPTYYALMTLLKNEYPNEIIKMGEELVQPVNDVLKRVKKMKDEYK